MFGTLDRPKYDVNIITTNFYYTGKVEPFGPFAIWANDHNRLALPVFSAQGHVIPMNRTLETIARDEYFVLKRDVVAIDLLHADARQSVSVMSRIEKLALYTDRFVFHVSFPLSAETRTADILDSLKGDFFPVLDVQVYPLEHLHTQVYRHSEMTLLNRQFITSYHAA